ncbi:MAG: hypothetical protein Q9162_004767 [Coniocarpon cinnabarinum]
MHPLLPALPEPPPTRKCIVTRGHLPHHLDPLQPPTKRKPLATLVHMKWCHHMDLLLPSELSEIVKSHLRRELTLTGHTSSSGAAWPSSKFCKVFLSLSDVLNGDFFTTYVKTRTVALRSEGRIGVDCVYSLVQGTLTLHLPAHIYQRTGLVGKPIEHGGRKHQKAYFEVSYDLRQPSMLHGKRGFERLVWAARNVLNERRMWVFSEVPVVSGQERNLDGDLRNTVMKEASNAPIEAFHPTWCEIRPAETAMEGVIVPSMIEEDIWKMAVVADGSNKRELSANTGNGTVKENLEEILEYLGLLVLDSPRVNTNDHVDPYICRYEPPGADEVDEDTIPGRVGTVTRLRWTGFVPCQNFVIALVMAVKKALQHYSSQASGDQGVESLPRIDTKRIWAAVMTQGVDGANATLLMRHESNISKDPGSSQAEAAQDPENVEAKGSNDVKKEAPEDARDADGQEARAKSIQLRSKVL